MATDRFWTGFEGGEDSSLTTNDGCLFVDDNTARTGEFHLEAIIGTATANTGKITGPALTVGQGINNEYAEGILRVFFYFKAMPSADDVMICGFCNNSTPGDGGVLYLNSNGTFYASADATNGSASAAVLVVSTWYRADIRYRITDPGVTNPANADGQLDISVYTSAGVLIEAVEAFADSTIASNSNFPRASLGHHDAVVSTYTVKFDDWFYEIQDSAAPTFPAGTRITRVDATAISENDEGEGTAGFINDFEVVTQIPFNSAATGMTNTDLHAAVTFTHASSEDLGITAVNGIRIYTELTTSVIGEEYVRINTIKYVINADVTFPTSPQITLLYQTIIDDDFDSFVFGVENKRGHDLVLSQQYCEVLHGGSNITRELTGVDSYEHAVGLITGDGSYQTISVGFRPQVVIVKRYDTVDTQPGVFKSAIMGGTRSVVLNSGAYDPLAIMTITSDGFILGPSAQVNASVRSYVYVAIKDGGFELDCKFFRYGAYVGSLIAIDSVDIVVKAAWEPDLVFVQGAASYYRTDLEVGDSSIPLTTSATVTDLIQALNSDGFEVGATINAGRVYYYFVLNNKVSIDDYVDFNTFTGAGVTHQVTGIDFTPRFAVGKRIAATDARWRDSASHTGANSTLWNGTTRDTTSITALGAGTIDFGSTLSQVGDVTKWLAFAATGEFVVTNPTVSAGPDLTNNAFKTGGAATALQGSGSAGNYPCAALVYTWTKVSGPGTVTFADSTSPTSTVEFSASGTYVLQLSLTDGLNTVTDTMTFIVVNVAPTITIGQADQSILLATVLSLTSIAADDDLPDPPDALTYLWTETSGPGVVTFSAATSLNTTASFSLSGVYVLTVTVSDSEKTGTDTITITVLDACVLPSADPSFSC